MRTSCDSVPDGRTPIGRVAQLMNFWRIHFDPPVIATMDHRAVLVAAWAAHKQDLFAKPPMIVRLDAHPDMGEKPRPWAWERAQLRDLDSAQAIANMQRNDDGGWVISAMEFGLAADVLSVGVHEYHRFPGDNEPWIDHCGARHRLGTFTAFHDVLNTPHWRDRIHDTSTPIWVDIDLDFATTRLDDDSGRVRPWTPQEWQAHFPADAREWFAAALRRASLVTIASEPEFCGGHEGSGRIASHLKSAMKPHGPWFEFL